VANNSKYSFRRFNILMSNKRIFPYVLIFGLCLAGHSGLLQASIPEKPAGYVSDFAHVIDEKTESDLNALIGETERRTSAEIAVVTVDSLEGMTVEDYANQLFSLWKIGKKGKDNGALVLIAPKEHKIRIEVGYGLEPILPDGLAGQIIREEFIPAFKTGSFSAGIQNGVKRIIGIVQRGEPAPKSSPSQTLDFKSTVLLTAFLSLFVGLGLFAVGAGIGSKTMFLLFWGGLFGGLPLGFAVAGLIGPGRYFLIPFGILTFFLGIRTGRRHPQLLNKSRSRRRGAGTGWVWGARGGGWSGGGGFGGFGGGSSGGGGASGGW